MIALGKALPGLTHLSIGGFIDPKKEYFETLTNLKCLFVTKKQLALETEKWLEDKGVYINEDFWLIKFIYVWFNMFMISLKVKIFLFKTEISNYKQKTINVWQWLKKVLIMGKLLYKYKSCQVASKNS